MKGGMSEPDFRDFKLAVYDRMDTSEEFSDTFLHINDNNVNEGFQISLKHINDEKSEKTKTKPRKRKKAQKIISEEMVKSMKPGSVIYDLAVGQGGNSAFSESDKVNIINGVKIMGSKNILNNLALTASSLYAKNLYNFVNNLYNKEKKDIYINLEDEIISKTLINKEL